MKVNENGNAKGNGDNWSRNSANYNSYNMKVFKSNKPSKSKLFNSSSRANKPNDSSSHTHPNSRLIYRPPSNTDSSSSSGKDVPDHRDCFNNNGSGGNGGSGNLGADDARRTFSSSSNGSGSSHTGGKLSHHPSHTRLLPHSNGGPE